MMANITLEGEAIGNLRSLEEPYICWQNVDIFYIVKPDTVLSKKKTRLRFRARIVPIRTHQFNQFADTK